MHFIIFGSGLHKQGGLLIAESEHALKPDYAKSSTYSRADIWLLFKSSGSSKATAEHLM